MVQPIAITMFSFIAIWFPPEKQSDISTAILLLWVKLLSSGKIYTGDAEYLNFQDLQFVASAVSGLR